MVGTQWPEAVMTVAGDFVEAWARMASSPDLCLADLDMPGATPLAGIAGLRAAAPTTPILVFTGLLDDAAMLTLLARGVAGFVPKTASPAVLAAAISLVVAGGRYLPERLAKLSVASAPSHTRSPLSARQTDVARLLAQGRSNKDIARALAITPATVKTHVAAIIAATGAANRTDAAMRARTSGLI